MTRVVRASYRAPALLIEQIAAIVGDTEGERLPYDAEGCAAFNARVLAELNAWWTKKGVDHWLPRIRLALWMFANCALITKCVAHEEQRLRATAAVSKKTRTKPPRRAGRPAPAKGS